MSTAVGFVGHRLTEARRARGITGSDLAALVQVSVQSISKYEHGHQMPRHETVDRLALVLGMPRTYFFRPVPFVDARPVFWRSRLSAPAFALDRAFVRLQWMKEAVDYLGQFFDFPQLDLLQVKVPSAPERITSAFIEEAADLVRQKWGTPTGPIPDVIEKIEGSGILVSRIHVEAEKVDAFSQWSDQFGIPFIVLSRDKASAVRHRFDALHELAHILFHQEVTSSHLNNRAIYKMLERQADYFASCMLLPEKDFVGELYAPTLDGMLSVKERWGASVAAMIMRCKSLDLLDDVSAKRLWINYARRGWRKGEPFDGKIPEEIPYMIRRSFEMLIETGVQSVMQIRSSLPFPIDDLEEIADLEPGTLGGTVQKRAEPVLKPAMRPAETKVVSLFDRKSR